MKIVFADRGWEDFTYWVENDRKIAARIVRLIKDIEREPFDGLGKPEPLRHDLTGFWSRRITDEHRLVYSVDKERVLVAQARYHY
jgi:toxin YoeB